MFGALEISARLAIGDVNFRVQSITRRLVRKIAEIVLMDLDVTSVLSELGSAAAFERDHLLDAAYFKGRHQLYAYVLSRLAAKSDGLLLEFGSTKGTRSIG
jgi:hypothetical protein